MLSLRPWLTMMDFGTFKTAALKKSPGEWEIEARCHSYVSETSLPYRKAFLGDPGN